MSVSLANFSVHNVLIVLARGVNKAGLRSGPAARWPAVISGPPGLRHFMQLISLRNTATFASKTGTIIVIAAATTMAPSAWAHHRPHSLHHEPAHRRVVAHAHAHPEQGVALRSGRDSTAVIAPDTEATTEASTEAVAEPRAEPVDESPTALERVQEKAMSLVGVRYRFGGTTPASGFDCSGFVQYVMRRALGLQLGRTAASQAAEGQHVERSDLKLGDLVFFHTYGRGISHVGLYVGHGEFVHAPSSGGHVRVEKLDDPYWQVHYVKAERLSDAQLTQD